MTPGQRRRSERLHFRLSVADYFVHKMVSMRTAASLTFAALVSAGMLLLGGCGGGSSGSSTPTTPAAGTLAAGPAAFVAFGNTPNTVGITGGKGPFTVKSSDSAIVPVPATITGASFVIVPKNVLTATPVTLTVTDALGATSAVVATVTPATISSSIIQVASAANSICSAENNAAITAATLCAGEIASASVTLKDANGAALANREVRFEALTFGATMAATANSQFYSRIVTVSTNSNGVATVALRADVEVASEAAFLRATDVVSTHRIDTWITVLKQTNNKSALSVVPTTGGQFSYYASECPAVTREYGVHGGTAPYAISLASGSTLILGDGTTQAAPGAAVTVARPGGRFTVSNAASTTCSATSSIVTVTDATGATATASHAITPGSATRSAATADLALSPPTLSMSADLVSTYCTSSSGRYTISGGTAPYIATASIPQISAVIAADGVSIDVGFVSDSKWKMLKGQTASILVLDSAGKVVTAALNCS